jgi:ATP-binding cassette subfamily F protein 3
MDEPTNHLDIDAVNALIVALNAFTVYQLYIYIFILKGALIIVSHDQYFVSTVCDEIWYIKDF